MGLNRSHCSVEPYHGGNSPGVSELGLILRGSNSRPAAEFWSMPGIFVRETGQLFRVICLNK